jgi:hypothetical protein
LVSGLWQETDQSIRDKWYNKDLLDLAKNKVGLKLEKQFGEKIYIFKSSKSKVESQKSNSPAGGQNSNVQSIEQFNNGAIDLPLTGWASEFDKYKEGWSRGRYAFWRKKLFADLQQDFIYTTKSGAVLDGNFEQTGDYNLVVRYLDGGTAGEIELRIANYVLRIKKNPGDEKFVVKDLGKISIKKGDIITITNISGENAIAEIVLIKN